MLKNNKISLIIAGIAILAIIGLTIFISSSDKQLSEAINAIPLNPAFVLETDDFPALLKKVKDNENFFTKLKNSKIFGNMCYEINFIDSLSKNNKQVDKILSNNKVIISGHSTGKEETSLLYSVSLKSKAFEDKITKYLKENLTDSFPQTSRMYDEQEIFSIKIKNQDLSYTICKNHFLLSFSETLIERSVRQLNKGISISQDEQFQYIYHTLNSVSDANLYINYENFSIMLGTLVEKDGKDKIDFIKNFGLWSAFDIKIGYDNVQVTGFTSQDSKYLQIFSKQSPQNNDITSLFPDKTSAFIIVGIENGKVFEKKYFDFLASTKKANKYRSDLQLFYDKYKIKYVNNNIYKLTANSMAFVIEDINKNGKNHNYFAYLKTENPEKARAFLDTLSTNPSSKDKIKELKETDILKLHFGDIFSGINEKFYTFIDDYIVFSETSNALQTLIETIKKGKVFENKESNRELLYLISEESSFLAYMDISHLQNVINKNIKPDCATDLSKDVYLFRKLKGPVFQFISGENVSYTSVQLKFDSNVNSKETAWECRLDTTVSSKPQIVLNHITGEKEIFVQDDKNKIYLIDRSGEILWYRQISGKILGEVQQIDYFNNQKLQLLFNTKNEIHLVDRTGDYVEGYPVRLSTPATNEIAVFDYDNNKNYRFAIALQNKKVLLLDKNSKAIDGWNFNKTNEIVTDKIQYFRNNSKDYIVFWDNRKIYILNRRGETRVSPTHEFDIGENSSIFFEKESKTTGERLVTTNNIGEVIFIYLADGKVTKLSIKNFDPKHYFFYQDITGDNVPEFIFGSKNNIEIFDASKDEIASYDCESDAVAIPSIYKFSDTNIQIGISSSYESRIFLMNKDEDIYPGFPLRGKTEFSITRFTENEDFSVIVGSSDNFLYKYMLN